MEVAAPNLIVEELVRHESFVRSTLRGLLADEGQVQGPEKMSGYS